MQNKVNVGIIGYGVVGKGTVDTLQKNKDTILRKTGLDINIAGIADPKLDGAPTAEDLINNPQINIIVELIGGYTHAKTFIEKAIEKGKHVVTANKALLAVHGKEIFAKAQEYRVEVGFEAAVGGGIPIIKVLKEDLAANNIKEIEAIVNGTTNYILTRMKNEGKAYAEILADAQKLGYAEADPTFDVEGIDSAHKITLLSGIAFGSWVDFDKVHVEGITNISDVDIDFAKKLNCTIKLLAIAKKHPNDIEVRVHPTMIPNDWQLASVDDVFNAIQIKGDMVGTTLHYGRGAGGAPTSSAVVSDIISISRNIACGCVNRVPPLGFADQTEYKMAAIGDVVSSFYMRFTVQDNPGVLSKIAGVLAANNISIASAIQHSNNKQGGIPLVFLTHNATDSNVKKAVEEVDKLPFIVNKTAVIRVEGIK